MNFEVMKLVISAAIIIIYSIPFFLSYFIIRSSLFDIHYSNLFWFWLVQVRYSYLNLIYNHLRVNERFLLHTPAINNSKPIYTIQSLTNSGHINFNTNL